jgi:hypothetical protein
MLAMAHPAARIYGLAPGAMMPSWDQQEEEHLTSGRMNLLQRLTDPQELAEAALFMAGGQLASGETLFIDSGQFRFPSRATFFIWRAHDRPHHHPLLTSTAVVTLAEIGDKTMLLAIVLAARLRRPWAIVAGILCATIANHLASAFIGAQVAGLLDAKVPHCRGAGFCCHGGLDAGARQAGR